MRFLRTISLIAAVVAPGQLQAKEAALVVDCTFEAPVGTSLRHGEFSSRPVSFKDMDTPWKYRFTIEPVEPGKNTNVVIESDKDFATIAGTYPALSVAPESYVTTIAKFGNCMFSSKICGGFVQLTDLSSDQAGAAINPISYLGGQEGAKFFHVDIIGKCTKVDPAEKKP